MFRSTLAGRKLNTSSKSGIYNAIKTSSITSTLGGWLNCPRATLTKRTCLEMVESPHSSTAWYSKQYFSSFSVSGKGDPHDIVDKLKTSSNGPPPLSQPHHESNLWHQKLWKHDGGKKQWIRDSDFTQDDLECIHLQELEGGRMATRQLGVLREDPSEDMRLLIENYTAPALASALRDREEVLQLCASLLERKHFDELAEVLAPFEERYVRMRRKRKNGMDLRAGGFDTTSLEQLRKGLMRMPRRVTQAHRRRAGVVVPLCNVHGVPSILFEKRSPNLRAHADEVCLPGGMVSNTGEDTSIASTCLREMHEEISGIDPDKVTVLGVLRCNWGEVARLTGVAVTPLVCYVGELGNADIQPNPDEVSECFTVPLATLLQREYWVYKEDSAPIFTGGPYLIWGLTGYILDRLLKDVLRRWSINFP